MDINDVKYYFGKAKSLPPNIVIRKAFRKVESKVLNTIDKVVISVIGTKMADRKFLRKAWSPKYKFENLEQLQKHFGERKEPNFFIDLSKREDITSFIYKHFSNASDKIIAEADKICEHIFDLLGSRPVKVYYGTRAKGFEGYCCDTQIKDKELTIVHHYEPIDWHIDFKSGYRWNQETYYKDIKYGHKLGVDVKVPWELSRFQHLTTLGEAYWLTKDEKYAYGFVYQVADWIEHNPPKFGVNWVCTMDVAIRACNWLLAWEFFKNSLSISNEFIIIFFKSLLQHGRHIKNNLEYSETLTSNHYLSDIVGLVYLGVLIPEFKESEKWKNFGINQLKKEMGKQVYPDGVDFEASACYHRLVLELFFYTTFLVIINDKNFKEDNFIKVGNEIFGKEYIQRLYKMFELVLYALKPNGRMPQIGDNDNGRLHIFANREVLDMRYLLTLGAIFFREPKFKIKEFGFCEEVLWIFGEKGYKIWQNLEENCVTNSGSKAFPDAGWYIMRNDKDYMIISCGPNGQNGNGGHCHNDKLSFELCIDGRDIIVDPGTYVYTPLPDWRNKFRSTSFHNTVVVDNQEQNRFNNHNLFFLENDARVKINYWKTTRKYDFLDAEHYGYNRLDNLITHRRQFFFNKEESYWVIKDILKGTGRYTFDVYFHIDKNVIYNINEDSLVVTINVGDSVKLKIVPLQINNLKLFIEDGWISKGYGQKTKSVALKYSKTTIAPTEFLFVFAGSDFNYPKEDINSIIEASIKEAGSNVN